MAQQDLVARKELALLGVLLAQLEEPVSIPARPWPVTAACEVLARRLPPTSGISEFARLATLRPCSDATVEAWFRGLVAAGAARPVGRGNAAHWQIDESWRREWQLVFELTDGDERQALTEAGETLQRTLSIAAKIGRAASSSDGPSTSGT